MRDGIAVHGFIAALVMGGCSQLRVEIDQPIARPQGGYEAGETHYRAVLADLGPPANVSAYGDGVAFLYEHLIVRESQFGIGINSDWIGPGYEVLDLVKFAYGKAWAERDALLLVFDAAGDLQVERFVTWRDDLGTGSSVQLIVEVESVVDSSDVADGPEIHNWGAALLQRPPATLNAPQNLDLGQAGLELRGAPEQVGQHTLEMRKEDEDEQ